MNYKMIIMYYNWAKKISPASAQLGIGRYKMPTPRPGRTQTNETLRKLAKTMTAS
jgi:hypothetical protein